MSNTFLICNGEVEYCNKRGCYKNGGECCHTADTRYALNPPDKRRFIKRGNDNWEIEKT